MLESLAVESGTDESYSVINAHNKGCGVFANRDYPAGALILYFNGALIPVEQITDFTHYIQIAPSLFIGPSGQADDYVNHSCDPNCAVYFENNSMVLKTIKKVRQGQEITFDYGTIQFSEPTTFHCSCGSRKCRGVISNFYMLPLALKRKYLARNMVPLLSRYDIEELRS
jgi:hypothetical protein